MHYKHFTIEIYDGNDKGLYYPSKG